VTSASPPFTVNQALEHLRVWEHAARTQATRVLSSEDVLGVVTTGDIFLFVIALRNVRRAAHLVRVVAAKSSASAIDTATNAFDLAVPASMVARDVIEHFDEYTRGKGDMQKADLKTHRSAPLHVQWVENTGEDVRFSIGISQRTLLSLSVADATAAAFNLRSAIGSAVFETLAVRRDASD